MTIRFWAICLLFSSLAITGVLRADTGSHPNIRQAPLPAWFESPGRDVGKESLEGATEGSSSGLEFLFFDRQIDVASEATTAHIAYRITSEAGLAQGAQLNFEFDPSYERLTLHFARTWRNGVALNRLDLGNVKILQQERDLDRQIYNGRLSTLQMLPDVRVGDIIEYATTLEGRNPVFGGKFIETQAVGWASPVREQRLRVRVPAGRTLQTRVHGSPVLDFSERPLASGAGTELTWIARDLASLTPDYEAPAWHQQVPFIELSEFRDWEEVVQWAAPLYALPQSPPSSLREQAVELTQGLTRREAQVLAILDFAQRDVRYLGLALGLNSHQPHPPAEVLARRFGDCKDKTALLCALLNEIDVPARPVLVNTHLRHRTNDCLPGPYAFNHIIARVQLGDEVYWLDPTRNYQRGHLAARDNSLDTTGLVIAPGTTSLTPISVRPETRGRKHLTETFHSRGLDHPSRLHLSYVYSGEMANSIRQFLTSSAPAEIARAYLDQHKQSYPALSIDEPPTWKDDERNNEIQVSLSCVVPDLWSREADIESASFYPWLLRDLVTQPTSLTRTAPLSLSHPFDVVVDTIVHLEGEWSIHDDSAQVSSPWYSYNSNSRFRDGVLAIHYNWSSRTDHVSAEDLPAHVAKLAEIRRHVGFGLTHNTALSQRLKTDAVNWRFAAMAVAVIGCWSAFATWLWRRPKPITTEPPIQRTPSLQGLGGWLFLPMIGLCLRPFILFAGISEGWDAYFTERVWISYMMPESSTYDPAVMGVVALELVSNFCLLGLTLVVVVFFFARRRETPTLMIGLLVTVPALMLLNGAVVAGADLSVDLGSDEETIKGLGQSVIAAAIWIPYFRTSRRVQETFIR